MSDVTLRQTVDWKECSHVLLPLKLYLNGICIRCQWNEEVTLTFSRNCLYKCLATAYVYVHEFLTNCNTVVNGCHACKSYTGCIIVTIVYVSTAMYILTGFLALSSRQRLCWQAYFSYHFGVFISARNIKKNCHQSTRLYIRRLHKSDTFH